MKLSHLLVIGATIASANSALAQTSDQAGRSTSAAAAQAHVHGQTTQEDGLFAGTDAGDNRLEVTYSGSRFRSRDEAEAGLLYRTALLANDRGYSWFVLLHMPGEGGASHHPSRPNVGFGKSYGHWQPHWNYYLADLGWQPWHPEWGAPFWTQQVDLQKVERFDLHAMVVLGRGKVPADNELAFDVASVLKDLKRR
jgi:hypothetical protein